MGSMRRRRRWGLVYLILEVSLEYIYIYIYITSWSLNNINASQALNNRFLCIQHVDALVGIEGVRLKSSADDR